MNHDEHTTMAQESVVDYLSRLDYAICTSITCTMWTCPKCKRTKARGGGCCVECLIEKCITELRMDAVKVRRYVKLKKRAWATNSLALDISEDLIGSAR